VTSSVKPRRSASRWRAHNQESRTIASTLGSRQEQNSPSFPGGAAGRMGLCCLLFESFSYDRGLPMSAAAVSATTTVEAATAAYCAAVETAADCYVRSATAEAASCATSCEAATSESTAVKATTSESAPKTTSAEATAEPARPVVSIRCAGIRVIPVVSIGADRSRADVTRTDADTDCDALSVSVRCLGKSGYKLYTDHQ